MPRKKVPVRPSEKELPEWRPARSVTEVPPVFGNTYILLHFIIVVFGMHSHE
jgi:hypothetical protein